MVKYAEYIPDPRLNSFVECYWSLQGTTGNNDMVGKIYPDGCMDIIFNFGDKLLNIKDGSKNPNESRSFVVGNMTTFSKVGFQGISIYSESALNPLEFTRSSLCH